MAGIGFNASQAWNPEIYVKYGIVNRIPCTTSSIQGPGSFKNGYVVAIEGNYVVGTTLLPTPGFGPMGIAVAQNQVDYTNPANLSVSVLMPTPGAVISVPLSCFDSTATAPSANSPIYVTSEGVMTTDSSKAFNANASSGFFAFATCIAADNQYADLIFPLAGQTVSQTTSSTSN